MAHARHVRRDRRQHVVAGEQRAGLRIPRADVVDGVAGRVHREPVAATHADAGAVVHPLRRLRRREQHPHRADHQLALERRTLVARSPRRDRAPRARRRLGLERVVVHDIGVVVDRRQLVGLDVERLREHAASISARLASPSVSAVRARALHRPRRERVVRDQLGAGLARDAARAAEVIGMRVRDHHRVHVLELVAGGLQPLLQGLPRLRARAGPGSITVSPRSSTRPYMFT